MNGHAKHDRVSLEIARRIAAQLPVRPEWIRLAMSNLDRWTSQNADSPGLLRCYQEWRVILQRPTHEVAAALTSIGEAGQQLRQNSPFAGALSPEEVWAIKRQVQDEASAA